MSDTDTSRSPLRFLVDRSEIDDLLSRFVLNNDERQFSDEWARAMFTEDVVFAFPGGTHEGIGGLPEFLKGVMARFGPTQHLSANHLIVVEDDRATVRANVIAIHQQRPETRTPGGGGDGSHFESRGFYRGEAARTVAGWRLAKLAYTLVWSTGRLPEAPSS